MINKSLFEEDIIMGQAIYDFFNTVAYVPFLLETLVFFYLIKPVKWQIPLIVLLFIPDIFYPYAQLAFLIIKIGRAHV